MWRSLVTRLFWEQEITGSNPVIPKSFFARRGYADRRFATAFAPRKVGFSTPLQIYAYKALFCKKGQVLQVQIFLQIEDLYTPLQIVDLHNKAKLCNKICIASLGKDLLER